jgi:hypothetical protein
MDQVIEFGWAFISAIFWFFLSRLTNKIDELEKGKATQADLQDLRQSLIDLDKRADAIDHSMQLRLVPRNEYKEDIKLLHQRMNAAVENFSTQLCEKEDRIKTIRVTNDKGDHKI